MYNCLTGYQIFNERKNNTKENKETGAECRKRL